MACCYSSNPMANPGQEMRCRFWLLILVTAIPIYGCGIGMNHLAVSSGRSLQRYRQAAALLDLKIKGMDWHVFHKGQ